MPWRNSYLPFFEGVPLQLGFQQMKDKKSTQWMRSYMVPNATENGIQGIKEISIEGTFTNSDFKQLQRIFDKAEVTDHEVNVFLNSNQQVTFKKAATYQVQVILFSKNNTYHPNKIKIENTELLIQCPNH